ncbi:MAG: hypothetical protein AAF800_08910 [Planctomycetota bacterium]
MNKEAVFTQLTVDDFADRTRNIIDRENEIEARRLQAFLTLQGLLFAAIGLFVTKNEINRSGFDQASTVFACLTAALGIMTSFVAILQMVGCAVAKNRAHTQLDEFAGRINDGITYDGPYVKGLSRQASSKFHWVSTSLAYPFLVSAAWLVFVSWVVM